MQAANDTTLPLHARTASVQQICRRFEADGSSGVTRLYALTQDEASSLRTAAALIIGLHGSGADFEIIATLLRDPSRAVRITAIDSLARLDCRACADALFLTAEDATVNGVERRKALQAIGQLERNADPERLYALCRDEDFEVASHAANALARLGDERAVPFLMKHLQERATTDWMRAKLINSIEHVVGREFGYTKKHAARASDLEKVEALNRLITWWEREGRSYQEEWQ